MSLFLVVAGAVAAMIGSAGGITSLVSYPALLAVGIAPLPANVTNAVALVASSVGSTLSSGPELRGQRRRIARLAVPAVAGGLTGAVLLLVTPGDVFAVLVPFLIAAAAVLLLASPRISVRRRDRPGGEVVAGVGIFAVAVYGGYFGAGAGVLTLALLLILVEHDLPRANAFKNIVLGVADLLTAVVFVAAGHVVWAAAVPLAVGAAVGGALGPAVVRRVPAGIVRVVVGLSGLGLAVWLLVDRAW